MYIVSQAPAAAAFTVATGAATQAFAVAAGEPGAGTQVNVPVPGSNRLNGQPFVVRAAGYVLFPAGTVTTAATPLQVAMYASNTASFAAASGNAIFSLTAVAIFTLASAVATYLPWTLAAEFIGGPGGDLLATGIGGAQVTPNGVVTVLAPTTAGTAITSFNPLTEPCAQVTVGLVSAASNNLNGAIAYLTSLILDA